jgi:hypothetical protein
MLQNRAQEAIKRRDLVDPKTSDLLHLLFVYFQEP